MRKAACLCVTKSEAEASFTLFPFICVKAESAAK